MAVCDEAFVIPIELNASSGGRRRLVDPSQNPAPNSRSIGNDADRDDFRWSRVVVRIGMKQYLPLGLAVIFLIVAGTVEARHSGNASKASSGRAATSAAPTGNAKGAGSQGHGGTAQSDASGRGTPMPASGAKNLGAKVPPSVLAQGRASASSTQLPLLPKGKSADAGGISVALNQMPTAHAPQTLAAAVPLSPTGQPMSPRTPNGCNQPAPGQHLHHRFSTFACGFWCYNRGLGYGMNRYDGIEDCEKLKDNPEAYRECLARKAKYSPALSVDGGQG